MEITLFDLELNIIGRWGVVGNPPEYYLPKPPRKWDGEKEDSNISLNIRTFKRIWPGIYKEIK